MLTNRDAYRSFTARVALRGAADVPFRGHRYTPTAADVALSTAPGGGGELSVTLPPLSIEFWTQY